VLAALALFAFLNGAAAANVPVSMINNSFSPANVTINVGDTVTWTVLNGSHDTVSGSSGVPSGVWNSNDQYHRLMRIGESFSFTFNSAGTFPFYCTPHWQFFGMVGTVRVLGPNSPPTVSIISPANGAEFSAPADITVEANAFDSDGTVTRVEFFMNGAPLGVVPSAPYQVTARNLAAGNYTFSAVATDNANATATASVSVTVSGQAPVITIPPQSQTVNESNDVVFAVQATGSLPLNYQWFFGSNAIPGATAASLLLTNVSLADSGVYKVEVTNAFGSASAAAMLSVTNPPVGTPPSITTQPASQTVDAGTNVTLSVKAIGSLPLSWQWFFNGTAIVTETNSSLNLSNVMSVNAGDYFVIVSNAFGSATSSVATLTVCQFVLSKSGASFLAAGGKDSVAVTASPQCAWTATDPSANTWIVITSGSGGIGPGTVTFSVLSNMTRTARSAVLLIAGQSFTVTQAGALFPAKNDFNHDGNTDFLWQNGDGRVKLWLMEGVTRVGALSLRNGRPADPGWRIVGTHDFNQDRSTDILWQHSNGRLAIWFMNGTNFVRSELISGVPVLGGAWRVVGLGDFNHDGQEDILFRHTDGYLLVWLMKGTRFSRQLLLYNGEPIPSRWRVVGVADVNNDGAPDILWQSPDSSIVIWFMDGLEPMRGPLLSNLPRINAKIVGLNDVNQDGKLDFIWRHADNHLSVWRMNGTNFVDEIQINGGEKVSAAAMFAAPKE
jgi:plastocyanin